MSVITIVLLIVSMLPPFLVGVFVRPWSIALLGAMVTNMILLIALDLVFGKPLDFQLTLTQAQQTAAEVTRMWHAGIWGLILGLVGRCLRTPIQYLRR